jgi:hypothetical protein
MFNSAKHPASNKTTTAQKKQGSLSMHFERADGSDGTSGTLTIYEGDKVVYEGTAYNAAQNPGDEPFGTNGQLAIGAYTVTRRQCANCTYKDNPAISNTGTLGTVTAPGGTVRTGVVMHRGYGAHHSQGCIVSPDMYLKNGPINTLMRYDQYKNGGSIPLNITYQDG